MPGSVTPGSVVLAPDSFKGTMTAATGAAALAEGVAAAGGRPVLDLVGFDALLSDAGLAGVVEVGHPDALRAAGERVARAALSSRG